MIALACEPQTREDGTTHKYTEHQDALCCPRSESPSLAMACLADSGKKHYPREATRRVKYGFLGRLPLLNVLDPPFLGPVR